jgi:hypothetical protein
MKYSLFALLLLVSLTSAALPSDEIRHVAAPGVISLQNVDPAAPKAFAAQDGNLSVFSLTELPNLGHYCTWADTEVQDEAVLTDSQKSILGEVPSNRTNENITIINSTSADQLVYL